MGMGEKGIFGRARGPIAEIPYKFKYLPLNISLNCYFREFKLILRNVFR